MCAQAQSESLHTPDDAPPHCYRRQYSGVNQNFYQIPSFSSTFSLLAQRTPSV